MTDTSAFEMGKNVATTKGKVVYQNEMFQLIHYEPTTKEQFKVPLLIVPPWINKFYILDLREKNSFVKWTTDQGHSTFIISWLNPDEQHADLNFEDYMLEGSLAAINAVEQATGSKKINTAGYCLGGTLLMSTLAYMAAKKDTRVNSATFFTTMLDFTDPVDMLSHVMIGSEGTLGFISSITFDTVPDYPHKASCLVLFDELDPCCRAVTALKADAPVEAVELIDSRGIRAVQNKAGLPDFLYGEIGPSAAALLIETRAPSAEALAEQMAAIDACVAGFAPAANSGFSTDSQVCETYWAVRKGLFPADTTAAALADPNILGSGTDSKTSGHHGMEAL